MNEPASSLESGLFFLVRDSCHTMSVALASSCRLLVPAFLFSFDIVDVAAAKRVWLWPPRNHVSHGTWLRLRMPTSSERNNFALYVLLWVVSLLSSVKDVKDLSFAQAPIRRSRFSQTVRKVTAALISGRIFRPVRSGAPSCFCQ